MAARVCRYTSPLPSSPAGVQCGGAGDEHAVTHSHRARIRVLVLDGASRRDAPGRGGGAIDRVELDLDELLGPREPVDLNESGRRADVPEGAGQGPHGVGPHAHVGDVDAASHHVVEPAARPAHAPLRDRHDRLDLLGHVAHAAHVALAVDRGRARLQHHVADAHRA
jgi:hypothetical protein